MEHITKHQTTQKTLKRIHSQDKAVKQ